MKAIWSGIIEFGMLQIPVRLYSGVKDREVNFTYLRRRDHCPIGNLRVCKTTGERVAYSEIVRGIKTREGDYVTVTESDFATANVNTPDAIRIEQFCDLSAVDPRLLNKPYVIGSGEEEEGRAYTLLVETLRESGEVAIVRFVLKNQEHLGMVYEVEGRLILVQLRYAEDLRSVQEVPIPKASYVAPEEIEKARRLIREMSREFVPSAYKDTFMKNMRQIIRRKREGIKAPRQVRVTHVPTPVSDLDRALEESIESLLDGG